MRLIPVAAAALATAGAMGAAGWGLTSIGMVGPRAGIRIATLVPQAEVTALFLVGLPVWACLLRVEGRQPLRQALAATWRGRRQAVWGAAAAHLKLVGELLGGGAIVWVLASLVGLGPPLGEIARVRLVFVAFAVFGVGLGAWVSAVWRGSLAAIGACLGVLLALAGAPLAVAPVIAAFGAWPPLILASMWLNPWIVTAGVSRLDLLRMQWVYALSPLGSVEAFYPDWPAAVAVYGGTGILLLAWSVRALRAPGFAYGGRA